MGVLLDVADVFINIAYNIPKFLYFLIANVLSVLDVFQYLFRRFAGLDVYYIDGEVQQGDVVYGFLKSIIEGKYPALRTIMISFIVLGVILLILSTILATIKTELSPDGRDEQGKFKVGNKKGGLIGKMIRGFFMMFIIPISCIFGIALANVVLRAVDTVTMAAVGESVLDKYTFTEDSGATSQSFVKGENGSYANYDLLGGLSLPADYVPFSGMIFKVCVYDANRVRIDPEFANSVILDPESSDTVTGNFGVFDKAQNEIEMAELIDVVFTNSAELNNKYKGYKLDIEKGVAKDYMGIYGNFFASYNRPVSYFSKTNVELVSYYYNLFFYNWILGIAFTYFIAKFYIGLTFGLIKRLITLVTLFVASPIFCSTLPLKDISGGLKGELVSNTISVIGTVGAVNLFMSILPYFEDITFFPLGGMYGLLNNIIQLLFVVAGFNLIQDMIGMLNKFVGGGSIDGSGLAKNIKDTIGSSTKTAAQSVGTALHGMALPARGITNLARRKNLSNVKTKLKSRETAFNAAKQKSDSDRDAQIKQERDHLGNYLRQEQDDLFDREYTVYKNAGGYLNRQDWERVEAVSLQSYKNFKNRENLAWSNFEQREKGIKADYEKQFKPTQDKFNKFKNKYDRKHDRREAGLKKSTEGLKKSGSKFIKGVFTPEYIKNTAKSITSSVGIEFKDKSKENSDDKQKK